jgi:hypothetical protein
MAIQRLLQTLLINKMTNETDGAAENEKPVQASELQELLHFFIRESAARTNHVHEAGGDSAVNIQNQVSFLCGGEHFKDFTVLNYALEVEKVTTAKKANLILNVDGAIAACFVDMIRSCGTFTDEEVQELLEFGCLNGLFVLGRSIGFIGHFIDQKRLKQPLYRHPWDDITFLGDQ